MFEIVVDVETYSDEGTKVINVSIKDELIKEIAENIVMSGVDCTSCKAKSIRGFGVAND